MKNTFFSGLFLGAAALVLSACATPEVASEVAKAPTQSVTDAQVLETLKASFTARGPAKLDRLDQTEIQAACSKAAAMGKDIDPKVAERLQKVAMNAVKYPADGVYLGDWREGEKIAQNGRGLQFTDAVGSANGANCYACHQMSPNEISYGNQGPSLAKFGSLRGVVNPAGKESAAIVKYTWDRIWNTHSLNACSNMPRFGDAGILTEMQVKHVMALLLDPASPVNK